MGHVCKGEGCFACKIKQVNISPSATPTRRNTIAPRGSSNNSWEKGVVRDERGVPLLDKDLQPIGQKEYVEKHRRPYEEARRAATRL